MTTIDAVRGAERPRGSDRLLAAWQEDVLGAARPGAPRAGAREAGELGSAFWLRSLRELGGAPQPPRTARSPWAGGFGA